MLGVVLHANDTPHQFGLGGAIAIFFGFLPIIGIQTIVSLAVAMLLRANKAITIPFVWITNPFTAVPIYGACFAVGSIVLPSESADFGEKIGLLAPETVASIFSVEYWKSLWRTSMELGTQLWIGCFIVATVNCMITYFVVRWAVASYRRRHSERIDRRKERLRIRAKRRKELAETSA